MAEQPQNPMEAAPAGPQARPSFHEDFYNRAGHIGRDLLMLIPELESVAIVPVWDPRQPTLPPGVICAGGGAGLSNPPEFVHMAEQLHLTLKYVLDGSHAMLRAIDARFASQAQEIKEKEERLAELNAAIAEHDGSPKGDGDSGGGAAPESLDAG